jgi:hypothetical protein
MLYAPLLLLTIRISPYTIWYMLLQIANIAGGVILSSSLIQEKVKNQNTEKFFAQAHSYEVPIGIVLVLLGCIGLVERLGILYFGINLGSSFPQALPAILSGLLLAQSYFRRFPQLEPVLNLLRMHKNILGIVAILCGAGSLLIGCVAPICYPLRLPF